MLKRLLSLNLLLELAASVTTLVGMHLGSTTRAGALAYLASCVFWWAFTARRAAWGLIPLHVGALAVTLDNLIHATT
jgi:hypothetical protein